MENISAELDNADADDTTPSEIRSKLSKMSFEDLQKLKCVLGTKLYKEAYFGTKKVNKSDFKRCNKNRPREVSSKIRPSIKKGKCNSKSIRDPRFDGLCGTFDRKIFEKNYDFINDIKKKEKEQLKKMLKSEKNQVKMNNIKYLIRRMENQELEKEKREKEQRKRNEERKEQIKALKAGKKPYFKSKFERKVGNMVEKYEQLKRSGKLQKYIERKTKKLTFKEKQKLRQN